MKLIIFDLDQTLVDFLSVHDEATKRLFKKVFGVDARLTELDFAGKSLSDNIHELARLKNIPEEVFIKESPRLLESYEGFFRQSLPNNGTNHILPGAKELLTELSKTDHILALYTGNSRGIVDTVFRVTGLGRFFRFCFYGTDVKFRSDMIREAIKSAESATGRYFSNKNVVVIGDSVRDVESGRQYNALTIAVATGFHPEAELLKRKPDFLLKDLKDYMKVLEIINSEGG